MLELDRCGRPSDQLHQGGAVLHIRTLRQLIAQHDEIVRDDGVELTRVPVLALPALIGHRRPQTPGCATSLLPKSPPH